MIFWFLPLHLSSLIGVMVIVHEFGHFTVAKLCKVRVEAFSFGFGPRLFGFKIGETDYKVCLLPLGGFVKMTGESESGAQPEGPRRRMAKRRPTIPGHLQPASALAAHADRRCRPSLQLSVDVGLMLFYFAFINEVPSVTVKTTTVEWVTPGSAAASAGIETGDVIVSFDNVKNPDWDGVLAHSQIKREPDGYRSQLIVMERRSS